MSSKKLKSYLNQTWYIICFILLLSFLSGILLSTVYYVLSPFQERAAIFDRNKQMLTAAHVIDYSGRFQIQTEGEWKYAVGYDKREADKYADRLKNLRQAGSGLYNGMIYPIRHWKVRGAVWYQGESNTGRRADFFRAEIKDITIVCPTKQFIEQVDGAA